MKKQIFAVAPALVLMISGCTNLTPPAVSTALEPGKSYWLSYDASRRGAYVVVSDGKQRSCAEPAPDIGLSFTNDLRGNVTLPNGVGGGAQATLDATALALAGRDNLVLFAREALYRICEANLNGSLANSDVKPLIQDVLEQTKEIAAAIKAKADAEQAAAQLKLLNK